MQKMPTVPSHPGCMPLCKVTLLLLPSGDGVFLFFIFTSLNLTLFKHYTSRVLKSVLCLRICSFLATWDHHARLGGPPWEWETTWEEKFRQSSALTASHVNEAVRWLQIYEWFQVRPGEPPAKPSPNRWLIHTMAAAEWFAFVLRIKTEKARPKGLCW